MPNNKRHTFKQIKNKKSIIHPSSRKAAQLQRISLRKDRLERVERLLWFKYAFDDTLPCATKAEVYDLIEMFINRNDDEILRLKSTHKVNSSKYFYLESLKLKEKKEYIEGFEIPDFMNPKNVKLLRQWDGDINSMTRIKIIRIEDPNNINNLRTTAQIIDEKRKLNEKFKQIKQDSLENIMGDFKMSLEQVDLNEQSNIDEIVNYNLLDDINEKLII
uniref:Translation machinery-associated protein 16 n=1 Tax=Rhizophagus irregularis (strain DAOM 181602 / DAOM 197198 / MUCL 43194) TaxID=747089 RepID=U9SUD3_RHIID